MEEDSENEEEEEESQVLLTRWHLSLVLNDDKELSPQWQSQVIQRLRGKKELDTTEEWKGGQCVPSMGSRQESGRKWGQSRYTGARSYWAFQAMSKDLDFILK